MEERTARSVEEHASLLVICGLSAQLLAEAASGVVGLLIPTLTPLLDGFDSVIAILVSIIWCVAGTLSFFQEYCNGIANRDSGGRSPLLRLLIALSGLRGIVVPRDAKFASAIERYWLQHLEAQDSEAQGPETQYSETRGPKTRAALAIMGRLHVDGVVHRLTQKGWRPA